MCVILSPFPDRCERLKLYIALEWIGDVSYNNDKEKHVNSTCIIAITTNWILKMIFKEESKIEFILHIRSTIATNQDDRETTDR